MSTEQKRAWSDFPGHVIVRMANGENGFDLLCAQSLVTDIQQAVEEAKVEKPCPFCGSLLLSEQWLNEDFQRRFPESRCAHFFIRCNKCGARSGEKGSPDEAWKSWINRPP